MSRGGSCSGLVGPLPDKGLPWEGGACFPTWGVGWLCRVWQRSVDTCAHAAGHWVELAWSFSVVKATGDTQNAGTAANTTTQCDPGFGT